MATYQFTLDGSGNRTQSVQTEPYAQSWSAEAITYTYNTQKNRLNSAGANSFTYNYEGQIATGYGSSYSFDYEHRLTAIGGYSFSCGGSGKRLQAVRSGTKGIEQWREVIH